VRAGLAYRRDGVAGPRSQDGVLGDQRAVEIEGEGRDATRKGRRQLEQRYGVPPVALTT
jgi:hypothetical protein